MSVNESQNLTLSNNICEIFFLWYSGKIAMKMTSITNLILLVSNNDLILEEILSVLCTTVVI